MFNCKYSPHTSHKGCLWVVLLKKVLCHKSNSSKMKWISPLVKFQWIEWIATFIYPLSYIFISAKICKLHAISKCLSLDRNRWHSLWHSFIVKELFNTKSRYTIAPNWFQNETFNFNFNLKTKMYSKIQ